MTNNVSNFLITFQWLRENVAVNFIHSSALVNSIVVTRQ